LSVFLNFRFEPLVLHRFVEEGTWSMDVRLQAIEVGTGVSQDLGLFLQG
jgi:hypothetical protein